MMGPRPAGIAQKLRHEIRGTLRDVQCPTGADREIWNCRQRQRADVYAPAVEVERGGGQDQHQHYAVGMREEGHRREALTYGDGKAKAALPQQQVGSDAAPPESYGHHIHTAVGRLHQEVVVHRDQSEAAQCQQRLSGEFPQNRAPGGQRDQAPEQREQPHRKDAESEGAKPGGVHEQMQRHHPIGVAVDARQLDALPRAAGGFQHGGAHETFVGEIVGGISKPRFVAPGRAREHIGETQNEVDENNQGRSGDETRATHNGT